MHNDGNIGIGTASPETILHLRANDALTDGTNGLLIAQNSTGDATMRFRINGAQTWALGIDNSDSDSFKIGTAAGFASGVAMTILSGGNVGIGVTDPDSTIESFGTGTNFKGSYDATNYFTLDCDSGGDLTIDASGGDITISDPLTSLTVDNLTLNGSTITSAGDYTYFVTDQTKYVFENDPTTPSVVLMENTDTTAPQITLDADGSGFFTIGEKSDTNTTITILDVFHSATGYAGTGITVWVTIRESSGNYEFRQVSFVLEQSGDGGDGGSVDNTLLSELGTVTDGSFSLSKSSSTVTLLQYTIPAAVTHKITGYGIFVH